MTMTPTSRTVDLDPNRTSPASGGPGFADTLRAEWIKFWTVRSTQWSVAALFVLGAGLTDAGLRGRRGGARQRGGRRGGRRLRHLGHDVRPDRGDRPGRDGGHQRVRHAA